MADRQSRTRDGHETGSGSDRQGHRFFELRHYVPQEILDVSFPVAVRGYDRAAVDAYVKRVNRVIAELKVSASPPHAVRHALEEAEAKVQGLLLAAREAADQITASAREDAEQFTGRAKAEAADLVVDASEEAERVRAEAAQLLAGARADATTTVGTARAEAEKTRADASAEAESMIAGAQADVDERRRRLHEELARRQTEAELQLGAIRTDTEAVSETRRELLGDVGRLASALQDLAAEAGDRFAEPKPDEATDADALIDLEDNEQPTAVFEPQR